MAVKPRKGLGKMLDFIERWKEDLVPVRWDDILDAAGGPDLVSVVVVDMVNGFCHNGSLYSPRIEAIIPDVVDIVDTARRRGINRVYLYADCHPMTAREFERFPAHCVVGTKETHIIHELEPFNLERIEKNSLSANWGDWQKRFDGMKKVIVVGNCTDLCVYQAAMAVNLLANEDNLQIETIVPANAVQTYHLEGVHPGDWFHWVFLYHMYLNGISIPSRLTR